MALFQRRPQASDRTSFYTTNENKNVLIVGLGNPGKEYVLTRHNAGFISVDYFVDKTPEMEPWILKKDLKCELSGGRLAEKRVIVMKPVTFMNLSGEAVRAVADFYKIQLKNIVVIHDDLDIDFGQIRTRIGGSDAGHNGIKSVTQHLGPDYGRLRIGIGPKPVKISSEDFVLQKFSTDEQGQLGNMCREATAIISEYIYGGALPHDTRNFIV